MYIKPQKKWKKSTDGSVMVPYTYYQLCESYRGENGRVCQRMVFGLGELKTLPNDSERKELSRLLDSMVGRGEYLMSPRDDIYEMAWLFMRIIKRAANGNVSNPLRTSASRRNPPGRRRSANGIWFALIGRA